MDEPPAKCRICTDERQYVGWQGQKWTTLTDIQGAHRNVVRLKEAGLYGIGIEPSFAIGQRALLIVRPEGNCQRALKTSHRKALQNQPL